MSPNESYASVEYKRARAEVEAADIELATLKRRLRDLPGEIEQATRRFHEALKQWAEARTLVEREEQR